jgi:hypothetical protein
VRVALARATLAQARGQPLHETAAELIEQPVRGHLDRLGLWPAQVLVIETLLDAGEHTAARNTLGRLEGLVAQRGTTLATTDLARLRGRLAEADGDLEGARASYAAATTSGRVLPLPGPTGGLADPFELSADEYAIAHLVAAGSSNRETPPSSTSASRPSSTTSPGSTPSSPSAPDGSWPAISTPPPPHPGSPERVVPARSARTDEGQD